VRPASTGRNGRLDRAGPRRLCAGVEQGPRRGGELHGREPEGADPARDQGVGRRAVQADGEFERLGTGDALRKQRADEPGQSPYFLAPGAGWREALDFEGSNYVGMLPRILEGLPTTDMAPNWQVTLGRRGLLVPGVLFIAYKENGGMLEMVASDEVPLPYRVIDPRNGLIVNQGVRASTGEWIPSESGGPRVYICYSGWA